MGPLHTTNTCSTLSNPDFWDSLPTRTFLEKNSLAEKRVAAFAFQAGSGADKALAKLRKLLGSEALEAELVLIDPKEKPTDDNERAITAFCAKLRG